MKPVIIKKNSLFLELGGNNGLYSLNYERKFYLKHPTNFLALKIGTTPASTLYSVYNFLNNIMAYYNIGKKRHYFEIGAGIGSLYLNGYLEHLDFRTGNKTYHKINKLYIYPTFATSYRYQANSGFLLKITLSSYYSIRSENFSFSNYLPFPAVSLGWSF